MTGKHEADVDPEISDDLIEIRDPEIDPTQIVSQIRTRIIQRRAELGYEDRSFPAFDLASYPGEPNDIPFDQNLYHYLRLANTSYNQIEVDPLLAASPATRLPVIGPLWQRVRSQVHSLVLFYVNMAGGNQISVNRHLVSVLNRLTLVTQDQQRTIQDLQAEVADLRSRLERED
jgi:hypothetical protein